MLVALGGQPKSADGVRVAQAGGDYGSGGEWGWEVAPCGHEDEGRDTRAEILAQQNLNAAIKLCYDDAAADYGYLGTFTPLTAAAAFGNAKDIKTLLARGANINAYDADGYTPLLRASSQGGNAENIQPLLANGADVNATTAWGETALSLAKESEYTIRVLQTAGAKKNPIAEGATDAYGNTALMLAAEQGDTKEMQSLIAAGADVNAANRAGNTALMMAARASKTNAAKVLLDKGANVNAANGIGETALMHAAESCDYNDNEHYCRADMVKLLLAKGANVHARDKQGGTSLSRAEWAAEMSDGGWKNIMAALKSAAKKSSGKRK